MSAPYVDGCEMADVCKRFHEWGKAYGDVVGLKFGPQNVVVLNRYRHVKECVHVPSA